MTWLAPRALLLFCCVTATSAVNAQTLGQGQEDPVSFWRVALALLLCLGLAVAGAYTLRSRLMPAGLLKGLPGRQKQLQLIETLRLTQNVDLCLVRCGGTTMLMSTSAQGVQILPYPENEEVGGQPSRPTEPAS